MTQNQRPAGVSNTPCANATLTDQGGAGARLLSARVDAITVAFRVAIPDGQMTALARAREDAALVPGGKLAFALTPRDASRPVYLVESAEDFAVDRRAPSNGYAVRLVNDDATVLVANGQEYDAQGMPAGPGWNVEVTLRAKYLATHTWAACVAFARRLVALVAGEREYVYAERVRRLDLAADATTDEPFSVDDRPLFVGRPRDVDDYAPTVENDNGRTDAHATKTHWRKSASQRLTGFSFASGGPLMARLYDKQAELDRYQDTDEKPAIERAIWARAGLDDVETGEVWRLEFQLRRPALEEFRWRDGRGKERVGINTLDDVTHNRDALWTYATGSWLRMVKRDGRTRRFRSEIDPRWTAFQSAKFGARDNMAAIKRERKKRGGVALAGVTGAILSNLASEGRVRRISPDAEGADTWAGAARLAIEADLAEIKRQMLANIATEEDGWRYVQAREAKLAAFGSGDDTVSSHGEAKGDDEEEREPCPRAEAG